MISPLLCLNDTTDHADTVFDYISAHEQVVRTGLYNFQQARITVPTHFDIQMWRLLLDGYYDYGVCEFLEYGWPINFCEPIELVSTANNHTSALLYRDQVNNYIQTELSYAGVIGPWDSDPFKGRLMVSPLQAVPKKGHDSDTVRVVTDLSFVL